jgi:katanin p60 ATPase-containing subunit A1
MQMDGLARSNALVFVLAATNLPWELDMAMLRRLEKRIYVSLPDAGARLRILETLLGGRISPDVLLRKVAEMTEGYSGKASKVMHLLEHKIMMNYRMSFHSLPVRS